MKPTAKKNRWGYLHYGMRFSPAGTRQGYTVMIITDSPEKPTLTERMRARNSPDNLYLSHN
jgi:hypothetical protein